jgi:hypothetical protein
MVHGYHKQAKQLKHFIMRNVSWQTSQLRNTICRPYYARYRNFKIFSQEHLERRVHFFHEI